MWRAARWTGWMCWPRRPFAGVAVAAIAGILLAEAAARLSNLGLATGGFLAAAAVFFLRPRTWLFWALVIGGYATLHLFQLHQPPAEVLAREIAAAGEVNVPVQATGRVAEAPRPFSKTGIRFALALESVTINGRQRECHARVAASWSDADRPLAIGERIDVLGVAANVPGPRNPGEFDRASYLARRGIRSEIRLSGISGANAVHGAWPERLHEWANATLRLDLQDDPEVAELVPALVLGLRDQPGLGDLEDVFQRTGTLHYFAIDGLKLGLLAWLASAVLAAAGLPRTWVRLAGLALLAGYAGAAGTGPASVRAVLVAAAFLAGDWLDRPVPPINSLGAAAALILAVDTNQLFTLGFELSFGVVLAILTLTLPVRGWLLRFGAPDAFLPRSLYPRALRWRERLRHVAADVLSVSLAAWVGSLPWTLGVFHVVAPVSALANAAALPLVAVMFALGICSLAGGWITPIWAIWMNNANWVLAKLLLALVRFCDAVPGGSFYVASPADWRWPPPSAELTVLDPGSGRAALLKLGGQDWLIDAGRQADFSRVILPSLRWSGENRLAGWIAAQEDAAHLGGASSALDELRPRQVLLPPWSGRSPALRDLQPHLRALAPAEGASIPMRVLFPVPGWQATDAADQALVFRVDVAGWRILWLGDAGAAARGWLAGHAAASSLRCDVLIAGAPESDPALLQRIAPRLIIRERGAGPPPPSSSATPTLRQEDAGAVTLRVYPRAIEATGFVNGQTVWLAH